MRARRKGEKRFGYHSRELGVVAAQIVRAALHFEQTVRRRDEGDGMRQFVKRAEGVARSMDEKHRRAEIRKVRGTKLRGLAGRVQRIGEQEEAICESRIFGCEHARLSAAVGLPAQPDFVRMMLVANL